MSCKLITLLLKDWEPRGAGHEFDDLEAGL